MSFEIVEMFTTLSGEAPFAGEPVFLIRFTGCNLECAYCDTLFKNEVNETLSHRELVHAIRRETGAYPGLKVLFTGGEPLWGERQQQLYRVIEELPETAFFIETNGSVEISRFDLPNNHFVVDWKTASSGEGDTFCLKNLKSLGPGDCIKIVVAREDLDSVFDKIAMIKEHNLNIPVYLSPQAGKIELPELADFIIKHRLPAALSLQLHKVIWGAHTRGV